jgi:hypothetical protein
LFYAVSDVIMQRLGKTTRAIQLAEEQERRPQGDPEEKATEKSDIQNKADEEFDHHLETELASSTKIVV